jgi:hypothetical protein
MMACRWRDTEIVRTQLAHSADPMAFETAHEWLLTALHNRDVPMVETIIEHSVKLEYIALADLFVGMEGADVSKKAYVWSDGIEWIATRECCRKSTDFEPLSEETRPDATPLSRLPLFMRPWYMAYKESRRWTASELKALEKDTQSWKSIGSLPNSNSRFSEGDVKADWLDLMLWAVVANEQRLVKVFWAKTEEPLRFAVWAAHLAFTFSQAQPDEISKDSYEQAAKTYCEWAVQMLAHSTSDQAKQLLTFAGAAFGQSVMDDVITDDPDAFDCHSFLQHPYCQMLARDFLRGDRPGSTMCIMGDPSMLRIGLHLACLGCLPVVQIHVTHSPSAQQDSSAQQAALSQRPWQGLALYDIPVVKMIVHFLFRILFLGLLTYLLLFSGYYDELHFVTPLPGSPVECVIWGWAVLLLCEELEEMSRSKNPSLYLRDGFNKWDLLSYGCILACAGIKLSHSSYQAAANSGALGISSGFDTELPVDMFSWIRVFYALALLGLWLRWTE